MGRLFQLATCPQTANLLPAITSGRGLVSRLIAIAILLATGHYAPVTISTSVVLDAETTSPVVPANDSGAARGNACSRAGRVDAVSRVMPMAATRSVVSPTTASCSGRTVFTAFLSPRFYTKTCDCPLGH